jgi:hypothetical protein
MTTNEFRKVLEISLAATEALNIAYGICAKQYTEAKRDKTELDLQEFDSQFDRIRKISQNKDRAVKELIINNMKENKYEADMDKKII